MTRYNIDDLPVPSWADLPGTAPAVANTTTVRDAARQVLSFVNPVEAFEAAIQLGLLSSDPKAENYAGHFMYMGTDSRQGHGFKHIDTRRYAWTNQEGV